MKGAKEAYKRIFHYYNESHENLFYISNMHWIYFIPNRLFMNILHGHKLVRFLFFWGSPIRRIKWSSLSWIFFKQ